MVATVRDSSVEYGYSVPEPGHWEMRTHDEGTKPDGPNVGENVLNGVGVEWDDAGGSRPLMVDLMDVLVELGVVKKPVQKEYIRIFNESHSW